MPDKLKPNEVSVEFMPNGPVGSPIASDFKAE